MISARLSSNIYILVAFTVLSFHIILQMLLNSRCWSLYSLRYPTTPPHNTQFAASIHNYLFHFVSYIRSVTLSPFLYTFIFVYYQLISILFKGFHCLLIAKWLTSSWKMIIKMLSPTSNLTKMSWVILECINCKVISCFTFTYYSMFIEAILFNNHFYNNNQHINIC